VSKKIALRAQATPLSLRPLSERVPKKGEASLFILLWKDSPLSFKEREIQRVKLT
jgi:hypothetical protein